MQKRIAVVFDSAGTLLHMYRVAKECSTGRILKNIESTAIVASKNGCALVVINTERECILKCSKEKTLYEFISNYQIPLGISCSNGGITENTAFEIIKKTDIHIGDIHEVLQVVRAHCPSTFYLAAGVIVDSKACTVPYVLSTGGQVFDTTQKTVQTLHSMGVDTYIASGDNIHNLAQLAEFVGISKERVFALATTHIKERIIFDLKKRYDKVLMVGDGMNDILALRAADVGIMTVQQGDMRPEKLRSAADVVLNDLIKVIDIVKGLDIENEPDLKGLDIERLDTGKGL